MSIIPPGMNHGLQFYLSGPMPCPYLPDQVERKLFTRLQSGETGGGRAFNADVNAALCRAGFRRSHAVVYRPACSACNACTPVRIPIHIFTPSRSQRRVLSRNKDLTWRRVDLKPTAEIFALFSSYQNTRHSDSDMAHMSEEEFAAMLQEGQADTHLYQLCDADGALKGCMIADHVGDGFSAVYSFFTPDEEQRSLGTQMILSLIAEAQAQNLPFIYLGYWVAQSRKMSYKTRFRPLQFLGPNGWDWLD